MMHKYMVIRLYAKCVKLHHVIFKYDVIFVFGVESDIFQFVHSCRYLGLERLSQKQILSAMLPTKWQVQKDRTNHEKT